MLASDLLDDESFEILVVAEGTSWKSLNWIRGNCIILLQSYKSSALGCCSYKQVAAAASVAAACVYLHFQWFPCQVCAKSRFLSWSHLSCTRSEEEEKTQRDDEDLTLHSPQRLVGHQDNSWVTARKLNGAEDEWRIQSDSLRPGS